MAGRGWAASGRGPYEIAADAGLAERRWLIKNGIPFDVAMAIDDETAAGWSIRFSIFEGGKFDWESKQFKRPNG